MKCLFLLAVFGLVLSAQALEREQENGGVEEASEHTTQTPLVVLKPKDPKDEGDDESDEDTASGPARCSRFVCQLKCQLNGCIRSRCLEDNRCSCYCPRYSDPFDQFFRSILTSHLEPGLTVRRRPVDAFPSFGLSTFGIHRDSGFTDLRKLFEQSAGSGGVYGKVFRTMQQTCRQNEDCTAACTNCTQSTCDDNLCRCSQCNRESIDSRASTNVLHTCRRAHDCVEHCKNCVVTTCRYGACECSQCSAEPTEPTSEGEAPVDPTTEAEESTTVTTLAVGEDESTTPETTTEILTVRTNETLSATENLGHSGKCVPKRCNHSCWERQCSKWNCVDERCECDGCPEEVSVVVKNVEGKPEKLEEDNTKYEIIF